ncbi:glycosyltransferase family protein [Paenactinomyces guangxiensis]|uniref:Streptomycin biosynthesis protein StrF n=1 Tax=Paenactinomyces guangxiensis TaxID=1490290 RepID=A0A7W1WQR4_9BACL|nr:glycosyltransferase family protein [Paenactinomyces guangxiensis]MBA4494335.1 streptomycin biosynthesis protein StrF [Paenactinomyces guangxiensis]MBH8590830.1 glycosyltransferase family protein [Paenactinomyces guangxiensis]
MNEHKFLFVTCVNDEKLYETCINYIQKLDVPPDYTFELLPIRGAKSMAEGYNQTLSNDAKYKIYLHQDTFILNRNFLHDILSLFQSNPSLGILGTIGCKILPQNGIWWEAQDIFGKVVAYKGGKYELVEFREVHAPFETVESIDGLLMATQYDLPWREDICKGFHFYDSSQSIEFIKQGYLVGVPKQTKPWCLHYHTSSFNEVEYRYHQNIFLQHYNHITI